MAIARSGDPLGGAGSGFTVTWSHDSGSGDNRFLVIAALANGTITGVTYAGVPMVQMDVTTAASPFVSLWGLENPVAGSNNIILSSNFTFMGGISQTYTGVQASTTPDSITASTDNATFVTSLTMSTTAVDADAWTFYAIYNSHSSVLPEAGTGSNLVGQASFGGNGSISLFDSNGVVGSGAESMQATHASSTNWRGALVSLAPFTTPAGGTGSGSTLLLMGSN